MNDQISFSSNRNSMQKFKVVLVGDQNVGKSSIIGRYIRNEFDPTKNPTIGIDFISKNIAMEGKVVRLQLWDTAGQQRFKSLIPSYLKDAHLALVVFDLTNSTSVETLNKWIDFIRDSGRTEIKIFIVGNKNDLETQISSEGRKSAQEVSEQQADRYREVSAKTGSGVDDLFKDILEILLKTSSTSKKTNSTIVAADDHKSTPSATTQDPKNQPIQLNNKKAEQPNARQRGCCS